MNVLTIDTSGPAAGVAVLRDSRLAYEAVAVNRLTHSVNLMPMVEEALLRAGLAMDQIGLIACVAGPGSFTGVRIGISAAKALAHAKGIPCVAVNTLEALAQIPLDGLICSILDARAGQVYGAVFKNGKRLMPDIAEKIEVFLENLPVSDSPVWFVGDGAEPCREKIEKALSDRAHFLPEVLNHLRPSVAAALGMQKKDEAVDYLALEPYYLRAPQAERERARREAAHAGA